MSNAPSVLVVDDEALVAMLIADWLDDLGCRVVGPVKRVSEALPHIEGTALDALLLDITLGPEDSYSLAELARSKGIPVAFITGRAAADLPGPFKGARVLAKPFEFEDFKKLVAELLSTRRAPPGA
jgi:CheY-like chemotaxis protein